MKAGDTMQYRRVSLEDALAMRRRVDDFIIAVGKVCSGKSDFDDIEPLDYSNLPPSASSGGYGKAIVHRVEVTGNQPQTLYRQVCALTCVLLGQCLEKCINNSLGRRRLSPRRVRRRYIRSEPSFSCDSTH